MSGDEQGREQGKGEEEEEAKAWTGGSMTWKEASRKLRDSVSQTEGETFREAERQAGRRGGSDEEIKLRCQRAGQRDSF